MSATKAEQAVNCLFVSAVASIEAAGCKLLPYDYIDLHRLAKRAVVCDQSAVSMFTVAPIGVGRCILQMPTIGAYLWWEQCGRDRYGNDDTLGVIAFAYICHYGRERDRIEPMYDKHTADKALFAFRMMLGCTCNTAELRAGLDRMEQAIESAFPSDESKQNQADEKPSAIKYGEIVARLCAAYHNLNPRSVLFDLSPDECAVLLENAPNPAGVARYDSDAQFNATANFQNLVRKLKEERKPCLA